ncbi:MAG: aldolase/citrate lyase family protein [Acidobacteria bacterium]|nr:aldolase/citrate lyase family protein [Acidobacteriota bacterium]
MTRAIRPVSGSASVSTTLALAAVAAFVLGAAADGAAQTRWSKTIEVIEAGGAAVANEHWRFIDMEHAPFSAERLYEILTEMDENRDADGRLSLTPLVRIPQDGDEDFKWAVKQVLDMGAFGVILPHVDTGEEAVRLVRAMRYSPTRGSAIAEPRGERGWGPGRATRIWGAADAAEYHSKADVWPLNPEGELFAVAMIESAEAVANIQDILAAPVSAIFVVPGDMSIDLGLGPRGAQNHPEVDEAFRTVLEACRAQDRVVCGCGDSSSRMQERLEEGWQFFLPLGG